MSDRWKATGSDLLEMFDRAVETGASLADKAKAGLAIASDTLHNSLTVIKLHSDVAGFARRARSFINIGKKGK